jgi:predicted RNase H-like HicB family nuclease
MNKKIFVDGKLIDVSITLSEIPGVWVAEVPALGLVTQGLSEDNAVEMALEAAMMVIVDDRSRGLDPWARGQR